MTGVTNGLGARFLPPPGSRPDLAPAGAAAIATPTMHTAVPAGATPPGASPDIVKAHTMVVGGWATVLGGLTVTPDPVTTVRALAVDALRRAGCEPAQA